MMRLLLDESVPRRLKRAFGSGFLVETVPEMGWAGTRNGELLQRAAAEGFLAMVTVDRGSSISSASTPCALPTTRFFADADAGRVISNEEMKRRIRS